MQATIADGTGAIGIFRTRHSHWHASSPEPGEVILGMLALSSPENLSRSRAVPCRPMAAQSGHRSRAVPGASMLMGVSSAKIASVDGRGRHRISQRLQQGCGFVDPVARAERSRSRPSRSRIWLWR